MEQERDKLIVSGISRDLDGEYECDFVGMILPGHPESLTNAEGRRVKLMTGIRAGEIEEAFFAGDNDLFVGLAAVVLTRQGKEYDDKQLWDAPMDSGLRLVLAKKKPGEGDAGPPDGATSSPTSSAESETSSGNGSAASSETRESDRSPTGTPESATSAWHPAGSGT